MIAKVTIISGLIILQNIFFIKSVFSAQNYIDVDSIVAIAETRTITRLELNNKKEKVKQSLLKQKTDLPNDKKITKLALDQLITDKLVLEYASNQGININSEQLNNVINDIAKRNNLSTEGLIEEIESDGTSFSDFREDIRRKIILDQVKKRRISVNLKISEFEIDNFIELQKERTPTQYNISHIFIEFIQDNETANIEKTNLKLAKVIDKLKKNMFDTVAIESSDGPLAKAGGLMGWKTTDELPDIFLEPIKSMKIGEVSAPINGSGGFHLLKLNDMKEFEIASIVVKQSKVKQILLKKNQIISEDEIQKKLEHIRNLIIEGMSFSEAAEKYSEDGSAANKGDLGWLNPGATIPEFEKVMDKLDLNEISQPVKTALGWHLIQVTDRREKDLSTESLRQRVKETLLKQKTDIRFNDWVKTLREGAHVEIWLYEN